MPGVVQDDFADGLVEDNGQVDANCICEDDGGDQEQVMGATPEEGPLPCHHQPERHKDHRLELLDAAACVRDGDVESVNPDRRPVVFDPHPENPQKSDRELCGDHPERITQVQHDLFAERDHEEAAEQGRESVQHRPDAAEKADRPDREEEPCAELEPRRVGIRPRQEKQSQRDEDGRPCQDLMPGEAGFRPGTVGRVRRQIEQTRQQDQQGRGSAPFGTDLVRGLPACEHKCGCENGGAFPVLRQWRKFLFEVDHGSVSTWGQAGRLCLRPWREQVDHALCPELTALTSADVSDHDRAVRGRVQDGLKRFRREAPPAGCREDAGFVRIGGNLRSAPARSVQEREECHGVEDQQSEPVPFPQAARLLDDAEDPLRPAVPHPVRGAFDGSRDEIERAADADRYAAFQVGAVAFRPNLLFGIAEADEQDGCPGFIDLAADFAVGLFCVRVIQLHERRVDPRDFESGITFREDFRRAARVFLLPAEEIQLHMVPGGAFGDQRHHVGARDAFRQRRAEQAAEPDQRHAVRDDEFGAAEHTRERGIAGRGLEGAVGVDDEVDVHSGGDAASVRSRRHGREFEEAVKRLLYGERIEMHSEHDRAGMIRNGRLRLHG